MDPLETITLDKSEKFTYANTLLSNEEKKKLQHVLLGNTDVFSWSHSNMAIINLMLASHKLNINALTKLVRRKIRFSPGSSSDYSDIDRQSSESRFYQIGKVS